MIHMQRLFGIASSYLYAECTFHDKRGIRNDREHSLSRHEQRNSQIAIHDIAKKFKMNTTWTHASNTVANFRFKAHIAKLNSHLQMSILMETTLGTHYRCLQSNLDSTHENEASNSKTLTWVYRTRWNPFQVSCFKCHSCGRRLMNCEPRLNFFLALQRPPSSSLSYGGAMNDDVRSPGSGSTPGPLSAQPPPGLGDQDPGKFFTFSLYFNIHRSINCDEYASCRSTERSRQMPFFVISRDDLKWNLMIN